MACRWTGCVCVAMISPEVMCIDVPSNRQRMNDIDVDQGV
jgi:hypothetical protein